MLNLKQNQKAAYRKLMNEDISFYDYNMVRNSKDKFRKIFKTETIRNTNSRKIINFNRIF